MSQPHPTPATRVALAVVAAATIFSAGFAAAPARAVDAGDPVGVPITLVDGSILGHSVSNFLDGPDSRNFGGSATAVAPNGNAIVAWGHQTTVKTTYPDGTTDYDSYQSAYYRMVLADGRLTAVTRLGSQEGQLNTYLGTRLRQVCDIAVAIGADGSAVVVWAATDMEKIAVLARRISPDGMAGPVILVDKATFLSLTESSLIDHISVAMDADGNFAVVWELQHYGDATSINVYRQFYNADGTPRGDVAQVFAGSNVTNPSVSMKPRGNFVVAAVKQVPGSGYGVVAQTFDVNGNPVSNVATSTSTFPAIVELSTAISLDGEFAVAWREKADPDPEVASTRALYAQRFLADGTPETGEILLHSYASGDANFLHDDDEIGITYDLLGNVKIGYSAGELYGTAGIAVLKPNGDVEDRSKTIQCTEAELVCFRQGVTWNVDSDFLVTYQDVPSNVGLTVQRYQGYGETDISDRFADDVAYIAPGATHALELTVQNLEPGDWYGDPRYDNWIAAEGAQVDITLPEGLGIAADTDDWDCTRLSSTDLQCKYTKTIAAGDEVPLSFDATLPADASGAYDISATVTLDGIDPDTSNNAADIQIAAGGVPTVSGLTDVTVAPGNPMPPRPFTLDGVGVLTVSVNSSNDALLPAAAIEPSAGCGTDTAHRDCTLSLTPVAGQTGTTTVTVTAADAYGSSGQQAFVLTMNTPPTASGGSISTTEGKAVSGVLKASDPDAGQTLKFSIASRPAHGAVALDAGSGAFTYTPAAGYAGADSFAFTVNDGYKTSNAAIVNITVTAASTGDTGGGDTGGNDTGGSNNDGGGTGGTSNPPPSSSGGGGGGLGCLAFGLLGLPLLRRRRRS